MTKLSIPDFEERRRLAKLHEQSHKYRERVRSIKHSCGHRQGHVIKDGPSARDYYKAYAHQPCGACGGETP